MNRNGRGRSWETAEEAYVRALYLRKSTAAIGAKLGRTAQAVKTRAIRLGLRKANRKVWTREDDRLLRKLYPTTLTKVLAKRFSCAVYQVWGRARRLGLAKTPAHIAATLRSLGNALQTSGKSHRFPKGHVPGNKGLRRPGWFRGRMRETQFKKGQRVHNQRNVGNQRLCDGYLYTKISDIRRVPWTRNWKCTHFLVWEKAHGPIPKGHCLWFKDGNKKNTALANLELITRAENMRRNTIHHLPPDLKEVIQLKGRLNRQIRKRSNAKQADGSAQPPIRDAGSTAGRREAYGD